MKDCTICNHCGKVVYPWEMQVKEDDSVWHFECKAKYEDDVFFDRDMEFGD